MAEEKGQYEDTTGITLHGSPISERDEPLRYFAMRILSEIQRRMVCQGIRYATSP